MKTEEDEAFDELARKQGSWGGGFKAKQAMAADKYSDIVSDGGLDPRNKMDAQPAQERQWIWLSDADIADVIDTTCQYTGSYEEFLIKKAERKIRSMNNG